MPPLPADAAMERTSMSATAAICSRRDASGWGSSWWCDANTYGPLGDILSRAMGSDIEAVIDAHVEIRSGLALSSWNQPHGLKRINCPVVHHIAVLSAQGPGNELPECPALL